jgi:hypothetical protein
MNLLIAKKSGRSGDFVKILSEQSIYELPNDLTPFHEYDSNYKLEDDEWFGISFFSKKEYTNELIRQDFNSTDYNLITKREYEKLNYLCSYQNERYYFFQKLSRSQTLKRRWLTFSEEPEIRKEDPIIIIKTLPDAIYDEQEDTLYFKKLTTISSIFDGISSLYKEATQEDTDQFLRNDFINLTDDYDSSKVKTANRKRIAMAMDTFKKFDKKQKKSIYKYIKNYCVDLEFSEKDKNFNVGNEEDLKLLLYGIEQRYYTTPIGDEKRLANSVTVI